MSKCYPNLLTLAATILIAAAYVAPFADLDYGILIRVGEQIVATGNLRPPETFSYTIAGADVPDYEWLFEIVLWGLWQLFGYGGLKLLKVALIAATFAITAAWMRREGVSRVAIVLLIALALPVLAPGWNLRPLYCTTIGLLLLTWQLHEHCHGRRPLAWWLPMVMLVWANCHPGVLLGQLVLLGALGWEWINRWLRRDPPLESARLLRLTTVGGVAFLATFAAPDPIGRMLCPLRPEVRDPVMRNYVEMQPLWQAALSPPFHYMIGLALMIVAVAVVALRLRRFRLWEVAVIAGVIATANLAIRNIQDCVLILYGLVGPQALHWLRELRDNAAPNRRALRGFLESIANYLRRWETSAALRWQPVWMAGVFLALGIVSLFPPLGRRMPLTDRAEDPVAATDWLETKLAGIARPVRIFATPDHGSYLVWRLGDKVRCYVDTRGFCYPSHLTADGLYLPEMGPQWRSRLQRVLDYRTDWFMLDVSGARGRFWQWLHEKGANAIYADDIVAIVPREEVEAVLAADSQATRFSRATR